jgi:hypothetical protein
MVPKPKVEGIGTTLYRRARLSLTSSRPRLVRGRMHQQGTFTLLTPAW